MAEIVNAYRAEPYDYREARALAEELGLSEPVAITLVRRGYRTPEAARAFLAADESHPPEAFGSMAGVVEHVRTVIRAGGRITVHGDFDVDGVCATAILVGALRELGADCDWLIPDRMADGYGLSASRTCESLAERGTSLLITVDCGVTSVDEVSLAKTLGMDVVVTDHHQAWGRAAGLPNPSPGSRRLPLRGPLRDRSRVETCHGVARGVGGGSPRLAFARSSWGTHPRRRSRHRPGCSCDRR